MFRLSDLENPIPAPVTFKVGENEYEFTAHWLYLPKEQVTNESAKGDAHFIGVVLKNWEGLLNEDDTPVEFTKENVQQAVTFDVIRKALIKSYFKFIDETNEGNW